MATPTTLKRVPGLTPRLVLTVLVLALLIYIVASIGVLKFLAVLLVLMLVAFSLARLDKLFTFVEPGTAKVVMLFGGYHRTIFNFPGYGLAEDGTIQNLEKLEERFREELGFKTDEEMPAETQEKLSERVRKEFARYRENPRRLSRLFGGLRLIGPPPFFGLHYYRLRWSVIWRSIVDPEEALEREDIEGELVRGKLVQRSETVNEFYLKATPYGLILPDVEDSNKIGITIVFLVMASVRNPYRAAFRVNNWWTAVSDNLIDEIRPWVGELSWEDIKNIEGDILEYARERRRCAKTGRELEKTELFKRLPDAVTEIFGKHGFFENVLALVDFMRDDWGVEVMSVRIDEIILPGGEEEGGPSFIVEAATKKYVAKQEADAIRARAEGEAAAIRTVAAAENERIQVVFGAAKDHGDEGVAMKLTEDMAKGGRTVFALGPLTEAVKDILGRRKESS